jgi:hypothetical protein
MEAAAARRELESAVAPFADDDWTALLGSLSGAEFLGEAPCLDAAALDARLGEATGALARLREELRQRVQWLHADLGRIDAVRQCHARLEHADERIAAAETVHRRLQQALAIVAGERHGFTQSVLDRVGGECARLYAAIHPEEDLGLTRFYLDPRRRASLVQEARFEGHDDVPPQAYFSEAHLDTLGFCLFLSLAKLGDPANTLVVLDDLFTSADDRHLDRLAELLRQEASSFSQLIVTTHSAAWRDRFRERAADDPAILVVELAPWSATEGIRAR